MKFTYVRGDLRKNRGANLALFLVLTLSAFLMASGAMVMERMWSAVDQLFSDAQPPHFLQMHKGEYSRGALEEFAEGHPEIKSWLIAEMVGFDSALLSWERPATGESGDLSKSLIDNLFVAQNTEFDFLLDEASKIPRPDAGEVYVPVAYQQAFTLQTGDLLHVRTDSGVETFAVSGFVRDAQMASSLSSSTRFLVSESDRDALVAAGGGSTEIIVEYLMADPGLSGQLQSAYEADERLPVNGQGVTYDLIRLVNVFSEGLVALALVFVGVLLIVIALLSVRFVIRGTLQDEVREIGAMKAIGLPNRTISSLYLAKYTVMTLLACAVGGVLAIFATRVLTSSVQATFAEAPVTTATVLVPVTALLVVFGLVIGIAWSVLRAVARIEVITALVHGSTLTERQLARRARRLSGGPSRSVFRRFRGGSMNVQLARVDLRAELGQWLLIPAVFTLAAVLVAVPMSLLGTLQSPQFVGYLGAPESDLRIDLPYSADLATIHGELVSQLEADERFVEVSSYANTIYEVEGDLGWEVFRTEVGDYSGNTVTFSSGHAPESGQIALSTLNAQKFEVSVGDTITLRKNDHLIDLEVSGVYQDVTSGGHTAKLAGPVPDDATGFVVYGITADAVDPSSLADEYTASYPGAKVYPMENYAKQTLSYVVSAFSTAAWVSLALALGTSALITHLYLTLRLARERHRQGILASLGFSGAELAGQLQLKALTMIVLGVLAGLTLAATGGEAFVSAAMSLTGFGITDLDFFPHPLIVHVLLPTLLVGTGAAAAYAVSRRLHRDDICTWLTD